MDNKQNQTIKCQQCKSVLPFGTEICPNCGFNIKIATRQGCFMLVVIAAIIIIAVIWIKNGINDKKNNLTESETIQETTEQTTELTELTSEDASVETYAEEIIFQEIPWGTSFNEVNEKLGEWNLWNLSGEAYKTCSVDEVLLGDYKGIDFEYGGINIISNAFNREQEIAGYTTSEITLYFAYLPMEEYLSYEESDTSLYAAQYLFEPANLQDMYDDLKRKLTDVYGEPSKETKDTDIWGNEYTYTYWYGINNTELVLRSRNSENDTSDVYDDEIYVSYACRNGDVLLQNASDAVKKEKSDKEKEVQEGNDTNGL